MSQTSTTTSTIRKDGQDKTTTGKSKSSKPKTTKPKQPVLDVNDRFMLSKAIPNMDQGLIVANIRDEDGNIEPNKVRFSSAQSFGSVSSSRGKLAQTVKQSIRNIIIITNKIKKDNGFDDMVIPADTFKDTNLSAEVALQCIACGDGQVLRLFSECISQIVQMNRHGAVERSLNRIDNGLLHPDYNEQTTGIKPLPSIENISNLFYNKASSVNENQQCQPVFIMNHLSGRLEYSPPDIAKAPGLNEFLPFVNPDNVPIIANDFNELKRAVNTKSKSTTPHVVSQEFMDRFAGIFFDYETQPDDQPSDDGDDDNDDDDDESSEGGTASDCKTSHEEDGSEVEDDDHDDDEQSQENEIINDDQVPTNDQNDTQNNNDGKNTASSLSQKTQKHKKNKDKKQPTTQPTKKRKHDSTTHSGETSSKKSKK